MWFIVVCTLIDQGYASQLFSRTICSYCFCILCDFAVWRVQVTHLHNVARALLSPGRGNLGSWQRYIFVDSWGHHILTTVMRRTVVDKSTLRCLPIVLQSHARWGRKGPGKRGHIVANTSMIVADTHVCPRAQHSCGHKFCVRDTKNVSDFLQKHFVSATNVSQFAQPKKHHEQQCVRNNVSSFARA